MPFQHPSRETLYSSGNLSKAIATAMDEHRTSGIKENAASVILEDRQHPAARKNHVTLCVNACMQPLLQDCLSSSPSDRPSARSIAHRLLLCLGPVPQDKVILHGHTHISQAHLSLEAGCIVAQLNSTRELTTLSLGSWAPHTSLLPLKEEETPLITVNKRLLVVATHLEQTLRVFLLPELDEAEVVPPRLPSSPSCIFSYENSADLDSTMVVVGTEGGSLTVFCLSEQQPQLRLLSSKRVFAAYEQDPKRSRISACVCHQECLLCMCGRYLIGVDPETLEERFIQALSKRKNDRLTGLVASEGKVWAMIATSSEVVVCTASNGNLITTIDCR